MYGASDEWVESGVCGRLLTELAAGLACLLLVSSLIADRMAQRGIHPRCDRAQLLRTRYNDGV